tara:strand:- start:2723 stop:3328 length:606 start_codon:yes stop_codon:yes gene_type:complete
MVSKFIPIPEPEPEPEKLDEPIDVASVPKPTPDEVFIKPPPIITQEVKEVETMPVEAVKPAKVPKPKKAPSQKQLEHLERIREKSNLARAKKVAEREANKKVVFNDKVNLDTPVHNGLPKGLPVQEPLPVQAPLPVHNTIIQQGLTEERVNQMIQNSIKATREQVEKERRAELIIKQKELAELEKKIKQADMVKNLLKKKR